VLHPKIPSGDPPPRFFFAYKDTISLFIPVIIAFAIKIIERANLLEKQKTEKEKENLSSELQQLRYQLQPHFFFNSLNNIYSLVERSPALAKEGIHSLSKMMRYVLYDTESSEVELKKEIEFITTYISLMKLRINNSRTKVQMEIEPSMYTDIRGIAPLLFISLIENAFKHGIDATEESLIRFIMHSEANQIVFVAENTNFPKNEYDKSGSGIGLQNLVKRLDLLYPNRYVYQTEVKDKTFITTLKIKLHNTQIA
jgi:LytS/YehU family sensor histidine kinase